MTKESLKQYLLEAVEAIRQDELDALFPPNAQPDLYSVVKEVIGLRGEVKKMSGASLRLNQDIRELLEQTRQDAVAQAEDLPDPEALSRENFALQDQLKTLLRSLMEQDDLLNRSNLHLAELPEPTFFSLSAYKVRQAAWQKGFDMTMDKWQSFIKSLGMYKTGSAGDVFDPQMHEAVAVKYDPTLPENTILETEVPGFLHRQQVIRFAKVVVNKYPEIKAVLPAFEVLVTLPSVAPVSEETTASMPPEKPLPAPLSQKEKARKDEKRKRQKSRKNKKK